MELRRLLALDLCLRRQLDFISWKLVLFVVSSNQVLILLYLGSLPIAIKLKYRNLTRAISPFVGDARDSKSDGGDVFSRS